MHSRGHSKPHVWPGPVPVPAKCPTPCRFAQHTLCLNALGDPRALTPMPTRAKARAERFKRRTAIKRRHAWLDLSEVQNTLHRRDYLWFKRCALAAIAWHLRAWVGAVAESWLNNTFALAG